MTAPIADHQPGLRCRRIVHPSFLKNMKFSLFIITALVLAACGQPSSLETAAETVNAPTPERVELTAAQLQNAQLGIGKPQLRDLGNALKANGFIEAPPQNLVSVSFPLGGYLKHTKLLPGMRVRRGEVLAVLEDPQYINLQQEYLTVKARLEYLSADLTRQETLNRDQSASDKALQLARAEHQTQLIAAKALAEKLRLIGLQPEQLSPESISKSIRLYAPIDGFVADVKANIGKYISPTDVLFELVNTEDIHLTVKIFEKDLPLLRVGQKVTAYASDNSTKPYMAHIILISQNVGEDRSVEVHCHLDQTTHGLLPGMFMRAEIEAARLNAVAVPSEAVVRFENKHYVFEALSETAFEMVAVEPGVTEGGFTELRSVVGEELLMKNLVLKNAYTLLMKMKNTEGE